ncbi:fimbrial protein [Serratia liquefaciens]|uniref:fimbrial protein n=1 Tax=Serratia liquefaciens TaxID=614 RepID=UPI00381067F2
MKSGTPQRHDAGIAGCATLWAAVLLVQCLTVLPVRAAENNVHLFGALVAEPCVIPPGDEEIQLDFGTIVDKYLYLNTRTLGQQFEIRLTECDVSLGKTVKVTFTGTENTALPGLLAIDASSGAKGIAIGMETLEAKPLPLNKPSNEYSLQAGNNVIALKAYVQGEPQAIAERKIEYGPFSAVANFILEYE